MSIHLCCILQFLSLKAAYNTILDYNRQHRDWASRLKQRELKGKTKLTVKDVGPWIALVALLISIASFLFTLYLNSAIGEVRPLQLSAYAVIRGMGIEQGIGGFPSDHLVLPMQWKNASGGPVVIQQPELILHEVCDGKETGTQHIFTLAGEYPDISTQSFSHRYSHKNSLLVDKKSVSLNTLIFHHKYYWDRNGIQDKVGYAFRFKAEQESRVCIRYSKNSGLNAVLQKVLKRYADGEKTEILARSLKHKGSINTLKQKDDSDRGENEPWWDYWEDLTY